MGSCGVLAEAQVLTMSNVEDMAWAPNFMQGESTFKFERPKVTVDELMRSWPDRYEATVNVEQRHALYCLDTTSYSRIANFEPQYVSSLRAKLSITLSTRISNLNSPLAQECAALKKRWEDEANDSQFPRITKLFPKHLPFDDPDHGPVSLPWSMANRGQDSLKGGSAVEVMMDKFIRWFLVNTAGS